MWIDLEKAATNYLEFCKKDPITLFELIPHLKDELALEMLSMFNAGALMSFDNLADVIMDSDDFMDEAKEYETAMREIERRCLIEDQKNDKALEAAYDAYKADILKDEAKYK